MRFLHTADWQMGMKAAHTGAAAKDVREARLAAAAEVVKVARRNTAAFIIVAGDTFEDNAVDRVLVQRVADILAGFGGHVYLIAGNHDPLAPGSVWDHAAWNQPKLHVLRDETPVQVEGGLLFPSPLREKHSTRDPSLKIDARDCQSIAVGITHGTVQGVQDGDLDYPIARDAARRAGVDYLALGHWHSFATYPDAEGAVRMAYSGTHETTKFGERDSGNAVLVEIERRGAPPSINPHRTGRLAWLSKSEELRQAGDLARVREQLEALPDASATLLHLRLSGLLQPDDPAELVRIRELAAARFLHARFDDGALTPNPSDDRWIAEMPAGLLRHAAERLRELCDPAFNGERPTDASPEVAARALMDLYRLTREQSA